MMELKAIRQFLILPSENPCPEIIWQTHPPRSKNGFGNPLPEINAEKVSLFGLIVLRAMDSTKFRLKSIFLD
jgi:hypothetical protein